MALPSEGMQNPTFSYRLHVLPVCTTLGSRISTSYLVFPCPLRSVLTPRARVILLKRKPAAAMPPLRTSLWFPSSVGVKPKSYACPRGPVCPSCLLPPDSANPPPQSISALQSGSSLPPHHRPCCQGASPRFHSSSPPRLQPAISAHMVPPQ